MTRKRPEKYAGSDSRNCAKNINCLRGLETNDIRQYFLERNPLPFWNPDLEIQFSCS